MKYFTKPFIFATLLFISATVVATDSQDAIAYPPAEVTSDLTDWICRAQSPGFDRHGYHYGSSRREAQNRCQLFHGGLTCTVECR